jgi:glycosyltransferase involved in cell wall biosynthesis
VISVQHFVLYASLGWLVLKMVILVINIVFFPVLKPRKLQGRRPGVSLLVPARNEAHNLVETIPGLLKQGVDEILVLDDESEDDTTMVVQRFAERDSRVRLIRGQPKPEGWMGKCWACHQLSREAVSEILIFTDADVRWQKRAVRAILAQMERDNPGLLSVFSRQTTVTLPERVLLPLIDNLLLCYLPYPLLRTRFALAAAANGQVMAFTRRAYALSGGHEAVRGEVLEDVRLAKRVKAVGEGLSMALGGDLIGVRMYRDFASIVEGLGKNLIEFHARSRILLALSYIVHLGVYALWLPLALFNPLWLVVGGLGVLERLLLNLKTGREEWEMLLVPLAPLYAAPVFIRAWAKKYTWKGRVYSR